MEHTELMTVKFDLGETICSTVNGPHGNAVIFACTICTLAVVAGFCYLTAEGHQVNLPFGNNSIQEMKMTRSQRDE